MYYIHLNYTMYYTGLLVSSLLRPVCSTRVGRLLETYSKTSYINQFKDSLFLNILYDFPIKLHKKLNFSFVSNLNSINDYETLKIRLICPVLRIG